MLVLFSYAFYRVYNTSNRIHIGLSDLTNLIRNIYPETLTFFTCFLMLSHQKEREREDKTPTPEVSNCGLTLDNNPDPVGSPDATAVSSLRRRNVPAKSNLCVAFAMDDNIADSVPTFFDVFAGVNLEMKVSRDSRKNIKYPRLTASYPKISLNLDKTHPRDIRKSKHTNATFLKPPCSQPPMFLKCKVKEEIASEDEIGAGANDQPDNQISAVSQTTDLDIQLSKLALEFFTAPGSLAKEVRDDTSDDVNTQTLKQYCNFEEKKVMRVAPHIRRKDVICDTVDAWSYDSAMSNSFESPRYKPLIFGGTYPIDLPLRSRNDHRHQTAGGRGDVSFTKKNISLTYDIDIPTKCE